MLTQLPLTGITMGVGLGVVLVAWAFVGYKIKKSSTTAQSSVRLLNKFFLWMAPFFLFMMLPHFWLLFDPDSFPLAMAVGYTLGHVFLYIAYIYIMRMICLIVPRLNKYDRLVVVGMALTIAVVTAVNAQTMIFGKRPVFDYINNISQFNAAPFVGVSIAVLSCLSLLPAGILFLVNAIKASGSARVRSALLALGFMTITFAGPLHDVAKTGTLYALADAGSIIGMLIVGLGIMYRFEQKLAPAPQSLNSTTAARV